MNGDAQYQGPERRTQPDTVTRGEFQDFRTSVDRFIGKMDTAMFAKDADNEFGQPGLMITSQKMNVHIDVVCNIGRTIYRVTLAAVAIGAPTAAMGKALGWW